MASLSRRRKSLAVTETFDSGRAGFPSPALREALEYFRFRGLRASFDYRDVWREEHALAFTVAKVMDIVLLKDIRATLDRAIGEGMTLRQFEEALAPRLRRDGWWGRKAMKDPVTGNTVLAQLGSPGRLRTLFHANLRAANAAGVWGRAQRTKDAYPYFLYELGPGEEDSDRHRPWAGTLLPVDHPWWDEHFPPNGWGCGCQVRQVNEAEAGRRGGATEPPPRKEIPWKNERTGEVERVDEGLDAAWAANPGKCRARGPMGYRDERLDAVDEAFARAAVRSVVESPILTRFVEQPHGDLPVGILDHEIRCWLGSGTQLVRFPEEIMRKQQGAWAHRTKGGVQYAGHDLTATEYRLLPHLIEQPQIVMRYQPGRSITPERLARRLNLLSKIDGDYYNVVIGCPEGDPTKAQIISFYAIGKDRPFVDRMVAGAETGEDGQTVLRNSLK